MILWLPAAMAALLAGGWAAGVEPGLLRIRRVLLESLHWPPDRGPLRIVFLSDLHVGAPHMSLARVEAIVASANAAKADLVLLGGDYLAHVLGRRRVDPGAIAARLGALEARLGVFGVMGNHDGRGGDTAAMRAALDAAGIAVLDDEAHHLRMARSGLWLVGLGGKRRDHAAIARVFAEVPVGIEGTDPVLVLAHDPAAFASIPRGVAAILAGHTHGGQVRLPFAGPVVNSSRAPLRHSRGRVEENGKLMYVTAGLGTSVLPIRFNCPPEMAILTIRTKPLQD